MVRFFTFENYHNKRGIGSTRIRVHQLIQNWPEAEIYKYGEKPDALIFQKVYCTQDYKFPKYYNGGVKILDICDPDWLDGALIKETLDGMDALVAPTQPIIDFCKQLSDIPMRVIKDRFDLSLFPAPKLHKGKLETVVWFGYRHNAELLRFAIPSLVKRNLKLILISKSDPQADRWGIDFENNYSYRKFPRDPKELHRLLQEADVCILPKGARPQDRFKSENKTVIAQLCGLPVAQTAEELDELVTADQRNKVAQKMYTTISKEYDVKNSVKEYKEFIDELQTGVNRGE